MDLTTWGAWALEDSLISLPLEIIFLLSITGLSSVPEHVLTGELVLLSSGKCYVTSISVHDGYVGVGYLHKNTIKMEFAAYL